MLNILVIFSITISALNAANILFVAPTPIVGPWLYFEEFIKDLLARGNRVHAIVSYNIKTRHANYSDSIVPALKAHSFCKLGSHFKILHPVQQVLCFF